MTQERIGRFIGRLAASETFNNWLLTILGIAVMFCMILAASQPTYISQ